MHMYNWIFILLTKYPLHVSAPTAFLYQQASTWFRQGFWCFKKKLLSHNYETVLFLGAFAKLQKATIRFMSVRLSVRMEQLGFHGADFHEIWYLRILRKSVEKVQVLSESEKNEEYFIWRPIYIFIISSPFLRRMRNVSDKICRENQNIFVFSNFFCFKSCRLWENMEKYCRVGQATVGNMEHALCMLDT